MACCKLSLNSSKKFIALSPLFVVVIIKRTRFIQARDDADFIVFITQGALHANGTFSGTSTKEARFFDQQHFFSTSGTTALGSFFGCLTVLFLRHSRHAYNPLRFPLLGGGSILHLQIGRASCRERGY